MLGDLSLRKIGKYSRLVLELKIKILLELNLNIGYKKD